MADLFGNCDGEVTFTVNKNYAERYNNWRQSEVLQKLKDRHGEKFDDGDDSSTSEEEDDNAKQLTGKLEKDFFRTLSCLKKHDPRIYDENVKFFGSEASQGEQNNVTIKENKKKKDAKPLMLRDYERKLILDREGKLSDDEDEEDSEKSPIRPPSPSFVEEQKALKDSFKNVLENSENEEDEADWGGMFKQRKKTQEEMNKEEEDYREWLKGQKGQLADKEMESDLKYLHDYWNDPNLDSNEAFLRDYILNKRFLDSEEEDYIPSYNEIVHDSSEDLSEDERIEEKQDEFEHKYNFRFEEPDQEFIKRYPRTMENSLRKKDDRRKQKRQDMKERKEHEKEVKREEIKQLKALKRKELMDKIEKIKLITGNSEMGFKDEELEEDFDPEKHDKRMSELFNDDYYGIEEEKKKPEFPELDQELELENWDEWGGDAAYENGVGGSEENGHNNELHCEDPDFIMDCDYDPKAELQREMIRASKKKKKHKRVSKFAEVISKAKPVFNPEDKTFDDYIEEYYKLDFEDIIGDLPCRFKYRKVVPNSFGLTVDEILKADDKELNRWCSLKKTIKYRPETAEIYDVKAYKKKAADENLKKRTLLSLYSEDINEEEDKQPKKKRKRGSSQKVTMIKSEEKGSKLKNNSLANESVQNGIYETNDSLASGSKNVTETATCTNDKKKKRRKRKKKKLNHDGNNSDLKSADSHTTLASATPQPFSKEVKHDLKKKRKKHKNTNNSCLPEISDTRLKAYGLNPKKFKNKLMYKKT